MGLTEGREGRAQPGRGGGPGLTLVSGVALNAELRQVLETLRAAHRRFVVVLDRLGSGDRHALLMAGALYAFGRDEEPALRLALANYRWSGDGGAEAVLLAGAFTLDLRRRRLQRGGRHLPLTAAECLALNAWHGRARERASQRPPAPPPERPSG